MLMRKAILAAALLCVVAEIPFKTESSPAWDVKVVDRAGETVSGITVRLSYQNYSAEGQEHELDLITDRNGRVAFPPHVLRASLARRAVFMLLSARAGVHASFGPHASVFAFGNGFEGSTVDQKRNVIVDWTGEPCKMNSLIVVESNNREPLH